MHTHTHVPPNTLTDYCGAGEGVINHAVSKPFSTICRMVTKGAGVTKHVGSALNLTQCARVTKGAAAAAPLTIICTSG